MAFAEFTEDPVAEGVFRKSLVATLVAIVLGCTSVPIQ